MKNANNLLNAKSEEIVTSKDANKNQKSIGINKFKRMGSFLFLLALSVLTFSSCQKDNDRINGQGGYVSENIHINNVDEIRVSSYAEVYITKGPTSLRIEGQSNILEALHVTDNAGRLEIGKNNTFGEMKPLKIYFSTENLNSIYTAGSISVSSFDKFSTNTFNLNMSGIGNINILIDADELITNLSGETYGEIYGTTTKHKLDASGTCDIACFDLFTKETNIDASGVSNMEVNVEDKLNVVLSGSCKVYYKGTPVINQDISGSSKVISSN